MGPTTHMNLTHSTEQLSPCCTTSWSSRSVLGAVFWPDYTLPKSQCHQQQRVNTFPITSPTPLLCPLCQCRQSHHVLVGLTGVLTPCSRRVSGQRWAGVWNGTGRGGKGKTAHLSSNTDFTGLNEPQSLWPCSKSARPPRCKLHFSQCIQSQHNYLQFFWTIAKPNGNKITFQLFMLYSPNMKVWYKITTGS